VNFRHPAQPTTKGKMNAYRVNAGIHIDGPTGKQYKKGQIIKSHQDLIKMFPEKFTDLGDVEELPKVKSKAVEAPAEKTNKPVNESSETSPKGKSKKGTTDEWD